MSIEQLIEYIETESSKSENIIIGKFGPEKSVKLNAEQIKLILQLLNQKK